MRHLNEIVRERNQYSRDAQEAWQDFINLKGRMDTELTKVTKRNNFLVEELESWKQQFLKFQAFAEQLTKETNELKVKIEGHKRENRRLTALIDQQKDDQARLNIRLSGTEKQRDDALEALVLQQEIAEELERERKRNKKDLSAMQHTNATLLRQRDEAQRVVLHLRALIEGQSHHMEHIVKQLGQNQEGEFQDAEEQPAKEDAVEAEKDEGDAKKTISRSSTRLSQIRLDGEDPSQATEARLRTALNRKRLSDMNLDVADKHLRDKTDAITYIIRNISEQCAAAVEGLDLARRADTSSTTSDGDEENKGESAKKRGKRPASKKHLSGSSVDGDNDNISNGSESEYGDRAGSTTGSYLHPKRTSTIPGTPDLIQDRSSTSMSVSSESTAVTPQRFSLQSYKNREDDIPEVPTHVVDDEMGHHLEEVPEEPVTKFSTNGLERRQQAEETH